TGRGAAGAGQSQAEVAADRDPERHRRVKLSGNSGTRSMFHGDRSLAPQPCAQAAGAQTGRIEGIVFTMMFNKLMRALYLFRIDHYQRWLSPYIDGELDTRTQSRVERHLEQCTKCRMDYERMLRASRWVSQLPVPEAPQKAFKAPDAFGIS